MSSLSMHFTATCRRLLLLMSCLSAPNAWCCWRLLGRRGKISTVEERHTSFWLARMLILVGVGLRQTPVSNCHATYMSNIVFCKPGAPSNPFRVSCVRHFAWMRHERIRETAGANKVPDGSTQVYLCCHPVLSSSAIPIQSPKGSKLKFVLHSCAITGEETRVD
jgi:hypothetical protein